MDHDAAEQAAGRPSLPAAGCGQQAALSLPELTALLPAGVDAGGLALLIAFAFIAGFIDAVVGGGGLIQLPALLVFAPGLPAATALGTSKFAGFLGTVSAAWQYSRRVQLDVRLLLPAALLAALTSALGAAAVVWLDHVELRPWVMAALLAVLGWTLLDRDFGQHEHRRREGPLAFAAALAIGAAIGFYDGCFGPGTGSFLIAAFVGGLGYSFVAASASAKLINAATNVSALAWFAWHGQLALALGVPMAIANVAGSRLGTGLALARGSRWVRRLFVLVVLALIAKLGRDLLALR